MSYSPTPTRPLEDFIEDYLRTHNMILCSNGFISDTDFLRATSEAGYENITVQDVEEVLRKLDKENRV